MSFDPLSFDPLSAPFLTALLKLVRFGFIFRRAAGDLVFLFSPGTEIDLLAALGAERPVFAGLGPFDLVATGRTIDDRYHTRY